MKNQILLVIFLSLFAFSFNVAKASYVTAVVCVEKPLGERARIGVIKVYRALEEKTYMVSIQDSLVEVKASDVSLNHGDITVKIPDLGGVTGAYEGVLKVTLPSNHGSFIETQLYCDDWDFTQESQFLEDGVNKLK